MSLAEVIRERERAKQRDTRSPQVNLAAMSDVEKQLMRKGIPASYDPGVSRTTMAESKSAAESLDFSDMRKFLTECVPWWRRACRVPSCSGRGTCPTHTGCARYRAQHTPGPHHGPQESCNATSTGSSRA